MPVTDLHVATLRALLSHDFDEGRRLYGQISREGLVDGYLPLVTTAFVDAARQHFRGKKRRDIVEWVAETRAQRDANDRIDPDVAERLLLWAFDKASVDDLDPAIGDRHQLLLLGLLIDDQGLSADDLSEFLHGAREATETALGGQGE